MFFCTSGGSQSVEIIFCGMNREYRQNMNLMNIRLWLFHVHFSSYQIKIILNDNNLELYSKMANLTTNLAQLQNKIKRDPEGFRDEFESQVHRYKTSLELLQVMVTK